MTNISRATPSSKPTPSFFKFGDKSKKNVVNICAFEYLYHEMVSYFTEESKLLPKELDISLIPKTLTTLEDYPQDPQYSYVAFNLERIGIKTGETLLKRILADKNKLFSDKLSVVKFICQDFWTLVYGHRVKSLRTNPQRTVFVLKDDSHPVLDQLEGFYGDYKVLPYLFFSGGLLIGAFNSMGFPVRIHIDMHVMPACSFSVNMI